MVLPAAALMLLAATSGLIPLDQSGYTKLVESQRGRVVLVNFWATWCGPCRAELPVIGALEGKLKGLRVITVSADEIEDTAKAEKMLREAKIGGQAWIRQDASDEKFITNVNAKWSGALPAAFLYDRSGKLVRTFIGETKPSEIEAAVKRLLP